MEGKNYYDLLGVQKNESQDDIQRAFRKRARIYHPDVCKEPDAEERFKEINEAYHVLSDPEKRDLYDRYGEDWQRMKDFESAQSTSGKKGFGDGFGSFHDDPHARSGFHYYSNSNGSFNDDETEDVNDFFRNLFTGGGDGSSGFKRRPMEAEGRAIQADLELSLEDLMHRRTRTIFIETGASKGYTKKGETRKIEVKIPAGVTDGSTIRLKGQGEPGSGGGSPGDLLLKVRLAPHHQFKVKGYDLETEVTVATWEAALGTKIEVDTAGGRARLDIPSGTRCNRRFRLKGKGLAKKQGTGDLYVRILIDIPETMSTEEKELYEKLSRISNYNPRGQRRGEDMDRAA